MSCTLLSGPFLRECVKYSLSFMYLSRRLDSLLAGGVACGKVTELVGSSAVGKTQVCMSVAVSALLHGSRAALSLSRADTAVAGVSSTRGVVFLDCSACFSAVRFEAVLHRRLARVLDDGDCRGVLDPHFVRGCLSRLQVVRCADVHELLAALEAVAASEPATGEPLATADLGGTVFASMLLRSAALFGIAGSECPGRPGS